MWVLVPLLVYAFARPPPPPAAASPLRTPEPTVQGLECSALGLPPHHPTKITTSPPQGWGGVQGLKMRRAGAAAGLCGSYAWPGGRRGGPAAAGPRRELIDSHRKIKYSCHSHRGAAIAC
jgi:hypothetical protein